MAAAQIQASEIEAIALMPSGEYARHWRCHVCEVDHPLTVVVCGRCGSSSRKPEAYLKPPKHVAPNVAMKAVAWRCPPCGNKNDIKETLCGKCGVAKPQRQTGGQPRETRKQTEHDVFSWLCAGCNALQSVLNSKCSNCNHEAPFLPLPKPKKEEPETTPPLPQTNGEEQKQQEKKKKKRKKLESWICGGCRAIQPIGHVRCRRCASHLPRLPHAAALRQLRREVEKLRALTEDLKLLAPSAAFECPVCFEMTEIESGCRLRGCEHEACRKCLAALVEHSTGRPIECPVCPSPLDHRDARNAASTEAWERHVRLLIRREEARRPFSFHCTTVDCSGRLEVVEFNKNDEHASPRMQCCSVCNSEHCVSCRAVHLGRSCEEHLEAVAAKLAEDETAEEFEGLLKGGGAMNCPSCSAFLQKIYGCDWMQCPFCDLEVCWATKGPRWGAKGKGDITGGCRCRVNGIKCSPDCTTCY